MENKNTDLKDKLGKQEDSRKALERQLLRVENELEEEKSHGGNRIHDLEGGSDVK